MPEELSLDNPLAVVGDEDIVLGFRALGFKTYMASDLQDFQTILVEILQNKTAICLIQDDIYRLAQKEIDNYKNLLLPIFVPFSKTEKADLLKDIIKDIRLKATGVV